MPISSLPGKYGIGTIGEASFEFIDFMRRCGATVWQMLPIVPTNYGDSPYQSCASNALNYYFIDLDDLVAQGLLSYEEIGEVELYKDERRVDYYLQFKNKIALLRKAFSRFNVLDSAFRRFVKISNLNDFAEFMTLKVKFDFKPWTEWEEPYKTYDKLIVDEYIKENKSEYNFWLFTQFVFERQWKKLKAYAKKKNVELMGDIPLYVAYDSVEMWKLGDKLFDVDEKRRPRCVAGVPPDAFSDDGQLWGNPLYDWDKMKADGYSWWNERISSSFKYFDILRIDHFRGFDRYFKIPYGDATAKNGEWADGPKAELFKDKKDLRIVAEDLGVIDDGVRKMLEEVGYPGMKVLSFAFDGNPENEHKASKHPEHCVCYTGTHDNMPVAQYIKDMDEDELEDFKTELIAECDRMNVRAITTTPEDLTMTVVRLCLKSKAKLAIVPLWDVLALGGEARINFPSTLANSNWTYRFGEDALNVSVSKRMRRLAEKSRRA